MANIVNIITVGNSLQFSEVGKKKQLLIGTFMRSLLIRQKLFNFIL